MNEYTEVTTALACFPILLNVYKQTSFSVPGTIDEVQVLDKIDPLEKKSYISYEYTSNHNTF
jgi:hypothetical protein